MRRCYFICRSPRPGGGRVVLGLILLCHRSFRGAIAFFHDLLDGPLSLGTVHNLVQAAVTLAQQVKAAQDLAGVRVGSHDELFQAGQPVWAGIDLDSTYCYLLAPVAHRDAETWGIHLLELADQGLHPDYTVADGGRGLRAGQALAWPEVPGDGDVFHGLRELTQLSATLERRAYAAITRREALERQMNQAKQRRQGRGLSQRLARARAREASAIRLADEVHTLSGWMQHDILALAGPDAPTRQTLYDLVMHSLQALEARDARRLRPVRQTLVNQRDALLAFARHLDGELEVLAQRLAVPVSRRRDVLACRPCRPRPLLIGSEPASSTTRFRVSSIPCTRPCSSGATVCTGPAPWSRTLTVGCAPISSCAARSDPSTWTYCAFSLTTIPSGAVSSPSGSVKRQPNS